MWLGNILPKTMYYVIFAYALVWFLLLLLFYQQYFLTFKNICKIDFKCLKVNCKEQNFTHICCCFLGFFLGEGPTSSTAPVAFNPVSPVVDIVTWGPLSIPCTSGSCLTLRKPALDGVGTVLVLISDILLSTECWLLDRESLQWWQKDLVKTGVEISPKFQGPFQPQVYKIMGPPFFRAQNLLS